VYTHFVGMVPWEVNAHLGVTQNGFPLGAAFGLNTQMTRLSDHCPARSPPWACPQMGLALTHESGHNYGLGHVPCGVTDPQCFNHPSQEYIKDHCSPPPTGEPPEYEPYPWDACALGPLDDPEAWYGFNTRTRHVITPNRRDIMSYGSIQWMSSYSFEKIFHAIKDSGTYVPPTPQPWLYVSASANASDGSASFESIFLLEHGAAPEAQLAISLAEAEALGATAPFELLVLDASGTELGRTPLTLGEAHWDDGEGGDDGVSPLQYVTQDVPFPAGAAAVALLHDGVVLEQRDASLHSPELTLRAPEPEPDTNAVELTWAAFDADAGQTLSFMVQLTDDGDEAWRSLLFDYPLFSARFEGLPGGDELRFRIFASDGLNTTMAESAPVSLPSRPLRLLLDGLAPQARLPFGTTLSLSGTVLHRGSAVVAAEAFVWQLSGPLSLDHNGAQLTLGELPPGACTIRLRRITPTENRRLCTAHFRIGVRRRAASRLCCAKVSPRAFRYRQAMDSLIDGIVWYVAFVFSVTLHEAAHALAAKRGGDSTAHDGGQLSLDPMPHIRREPFGMVALPLISLLVMGWPLGFASAPYDPVWADRYPKRAAWMSLAGPAANLLIILGCAGVIWAGIALGELDSPNQAIYTNIAESVHGGVWASVAFVVSIFFSLNLILFIFNLLPVPPLDGAGAIGLLLSDDHARVLRQAKANPMFGMMGMMVAWYAFASIFSPVFLVSLNLLYPGANYN